MQRSLDSDNNPLLSLAMASQNTAFIDSAMAYLEYDLGLLDMC